MSKVVKVKQTFGFGNVLPKGYELQVITNSTKPWAAEIEKALKAAGISNPSSSMSNPNNWVVVG